MDWNALSVHSKIADLVRNCTGNLEGICRKMVKDRSCNPIKYLELMIHRTEGLLNGLTQLRDKINEKNKGRC